MKTYGFCKIFVLGADTKTVMAMLADLLGGTFQRRSMALPGLIVDVLANPDADASAIDFVHWQVLVELETDESQDPQPMVGAAAWTLTSFCRRGL